MDNNEKTWEERQESYNKKIAKYWAELLEGGSNLEELSRAELEKLILDYGPDEFLAELRLPLPRPWKTRKETFSDLAELVCSETELNEEEVGDALALMTISSLQIELEVTKLINQYPEKAKSFFRNSRVLPVVMKKKLPGLTNNAQIAEKVDFASDVAEVRNMTGILVEEMLGIFSEIRKAQLLCSQEDQTFRPELIPYLPDEVLEWDIAWEIQLLPELGPTTVKDWAHTMASYILLFEKIPEEHPQRSEPHHHGHRIRWEYFIEQTRPAMKNRQARQQEEWEEQERVLENEEVDLIKRKFSDPSTYPLLYKNGNAGFPDEWSTGDFSAADENYYEAHMAFYKLDKKRTELKNRQADLEEKNQKIRFAEIKDLISKSLARQVKNSSP
ncbi:hypothetical protein N9C83_02800 [Opitutales bacterium]|nr:hypothetical protein [Opitutales bacterium]